MDEREHLNTVPHLTSPKNVGIYGGSFSPPHLGHACAVLYAMSRYDLDQVWVIPCGTHPEGKKLEPFWQRFKMCKIAFGHLNNVEVVPIEYYMPGASYTHVTLKAISDHEPKARLHLIVGEDVFKSIPTWEGGKETMELATLLPIPRSGYGEQPHLLPEVSSTVIRQRIHDDKNVESYVDADVREYIEGKGLYS